MKYYILVWNDSIKQSVTENFSPEMATLCQTLSQVVNDFRSFDQTVEQVTVAVAPLGMYYGDTNGGFASGTKWHNESRTLYLMWNTYWNFFRFYMLDEENAKILIEKSGHHQPQHEFVFEELERTKYFWKEDFDEYLKLNNGLIEKLQFVSQKGKTNG